MLGLTKWHQLAAVNSILVLIELLHFNTFSIFVPFLMNLCSLWADVNLLYYGSAFVTYLPLFKTSKYTLIAGARPRTLESQEEMGQTLLHYPFIENIYEVLISYKMKQRREVSIIQKRHRENKRDKRKGNEMDETFSHSFSHPLLLSRGCGGSSSRRTRNTSRFSAIWDSSASYISEM